MPTSIACSLFTTTTATSDLKTAGRRCGAEEEIAPAFIPAGTRWGVFLRIDLKQKDRRQEGHLTAVLFCPLLSLHKMKDARSVCVCVCVCLWVILPSLCPLYEMSPDGDWFFKCWHPCLRSTPPFYTHVHTHTYTHTHTLLCAEQVRHTNISVPSSSLWLPATTIDWQKYACKQTDTHTHTHTYTHTYTYTYTRTPPFTHTHSHPNTKAQSKLNKIIY